MQMAGSPIKGHVQQLSLDILPMTTDAEMKPDHAYFMPGLSHAYFMYVVDQMLSTCNVSNLMKAK